MFVFGCAYVEYLSFSDKISQKYLSFSDKIGTNSYCFPTNRAGKEGACWRGEPVRFGAFGRSRCCKGLGLGCIADGTILALNRHLGGCRSFLPVSRRFPGRDSGNGSVCGVRVHWTSMSSQPCAGVQSSIVAEKPDSFNEPSRNRGWVLSRLKSFNAALRQLSSDRGWRPGSL